jgi:ribosomal protein S18 acetylase RimI-like enzyme
VETYAWNVEVQVVERNHGIGAGKRMLVYALEQLEQSNFEVVYINASENNEVARHLYESAGFHPFLRPSCYEL